MAVEIAHSDDSSSRYALRCSATCHNKPPAAAVTIHSRANFLASLGEYGGGEGGEGGLSVNVKTNADEIGQAATAAAGFTRRRPCC